MTRTGAAATNHHAEQLSYMLHNKLAKLQVAYCLLPAVCLFAIVVLKSKQFDCSMLSGMTPLSLPVLHSAAFYLTPGQYVHLGSSAYVCTDSVDAIANDYPNEQ